MFHSICGQVSCTKIFPKSEKKNVTPQTFKLKSDKITSDLRQLDESSGLHCSMTEIKREWIYMDLDTKMSFWCKRVWMCGNKEMWQWDILDDVITVGDVTQSGATQICRKIARQLSEWQNYSVYSVILTELI